MTLTPREYLYQHFGPADRRWIESLSDERCWELCDRLISEPKNLPNFPIWITFPSEELHPLPDIPGEYPNWR